MQYQFRCEKCGKEFEVEQAIKDAHGAIHCGEKAQRIYNTLATSWSWRPGFDYGLGKEFGSQRERDNYIAENNFRRIKS